MSFNILRKEVSFRNILNDIYFQLYDINLHDSPTCVSHYLSEGWNDHDHNQCIEHQLNVSGSNDTLLFFIVIYYCIQSCHLNKSMNQ